MMRKPFLGVAAAAAALLFGAACADNADSEEASTTVAAEEQASTEDTSAAMDHSAHSLLEVEEGVAVPEISLTVEADKMSGQNIFVELGNFEITPENASLDPVDGEGHLHLFIDGERKARFYNTALHLDGLEPGEHEIAVEVSANNHSAYAVDGKEIRAAQTITVPEESDGMDMKQSEPTEVEGEAAPKVSLEVFEDPKAGWNLNVDLENFTLSPEGASAEPVEGEGHLHVLIDGVKVERLYGEWTHLSGLEEGEHTVIVELRGNDHSPYTIDGENIVAEETIVVTAEQAGEKPDAHDHDEMGMDDMDTEEMSEEG